MNIKNNFFKSELFDVEPGEDGETNPRMYGRQLSNWIRRKFIQKGYDVEEVIPEDWGWCVMCARDPYWLWIGCSSVVDYDTAQTDDPPPNKEDVVWCCFAEAEVPFFKRLFKRINTEPGLRKLKTELLEILNSENGLQIVDEP